MQNLIIRKGFNKRAAEEDGPSFEQQFGILANAVIADKLPLMDSMKMAFQLIDKNEDNSEACGAAVYLVGKSVVFVPAFFKNNKLKTGDMMFIANTQQFLPLSDPWLAWLKNKDLNDSGDIMPNEVTDGMTTHKGTTIRDLADPIIKTASVYLKGLLRTDPDLTKTASQTSILDTALQLGKNATASMLDNLIKDTNFLNATLAFYSGNDLDGFAKKASAMAEEAPEVELILPLDKEAKTLSDHELKALYKDGFFIRKLASKESPDVIRPKQLNGMFTAVTGPGRYKLLQMDGEVKDVLVLSICDASADGFSGWFSPCVCYAGDPWDGMNAASYMSRTKGKWGGHGKGLVVVSGSALKAIPTGTMAIADSKTAFSSEMTNVAGKEMSVGGLQRIPEDSILIFPNGTVTRFTKHMCERSTDGKGWTTGDTTVTLAEDPAQVAPIIKSNAIILPKSTRIIIPKRFNEDGTYKEEASPADWREDTDASPITYVTMGTMDAFLTEYCKKKYNKAKIYSNGQDYVISGDKSEAEEPKSLKEAALSLVQDYDLDPAIAKVMLKEASNGTSYDNPRSSTYYITKTAAEMDDPDANLGMTIHNNQDPRIEQQSMPSVIEDPAQLQQAVQTAAQNGIKEVFDVTALKLLVRQNRFFDDIADDIPLFMRALDSLCRKLFQFYWHTDKMEEKYGMVKLKALEESLKVALDSLSEITIFFKLRSVDGSGTTRDASGDLMTGQML